MEERILKVLHIQMQAATKGAEEYARLLSSVTKTIGQMAEAAMKAYYWMVCGDAYDTEHPRG